MFTHFFCRLLPVPDLGSAHASSLAACSSTERFEVPPVASRRSTAASKSHTAITCEHKRGGKQQVGVSGQRNDFRHVNDAFVRLRPRGRRPPGRSGAAMPFGVGWCGTA